MYIGFSIYFIIIVLVVVGILIIIKYIFEIHLKQNYKTK
jgi:hypothetical protein